MIIILYFFDLPIFFSILPVAWRVILAYCFGLYCSTFHSATQLTLQPCVEYVEHRAAQTAMGSSLCTSLRHFRGKVQSAVLVLLHLFNFNIEQFNFNVTEPKLLEFYQNFFTLIKLEWFKIEVKKGVVIMWQHLICIITVTEWSNKIVTKRLKRHFVIQIYFILLSIVNSILGAFTVEFWQAIVFFSVLNFFMLYWHLRVFFFIVIHSYYVSLLALAVFNTFIVIG